MAAGGGKHVDFNTGDDIETEDNLEGRPYPSYVEERSKRDTVHIMENGLLNGGWEASFNRSLIDTYGIKRILTLCDEQIPDDLKFNDIIYKFVTMEDNENEDILSCLPDCIQFIRDGHANNETVLIHSYAGVSRSATIGIAFLMNKYKISYIQARNHFESNIPVRLNRAFIKQLEMLERMKYIVDPNDQEFRVFMFNWLIKYIMPYMTIINEPHPPYIAARFRSNDEFTLALNEYFRRLGLVEKYAPVENGVKIMCRVCHNKLFNEIDIIQNDNFLDDPNACSDIFIGPKPWMDQFVENKTVLKPNGSIICVNCKQKLGDYIISTFRFECECPLHLDFCFHPNIVHDFARINVLAFKLISDRLIRDADAVEN